MIPWWWSWLLTAVGVTGLLIAGNRKSWGWLIGLGVQILWITYAVTTEQWGFIASAIAYGAVYARNFARWRRERRHVRMECMACGHRFDGWMPDGPTRCPACGARTVYVLGIPHDQLATGPSRARP